MPVDYQRSLEHALDFLAHLAERLLDEPPVGHHFSQQRVALAARLAIGRHRLGVSFDHGLVNVRENVGPGVAGIEVRDDLHRLHPAWRFRGDFGGLLVIFLDAQDRLAQGPVQTWIVRQVLANRVADANELPLDDTLFRLPTRSQENLAVARSKTFLAVRDGMRCEPQAGGQRARHRANRLMRRAAGEIHGGHEENQQESDRQCRPGGDTQQTRHGDDSLWRTGHGSWRGSQPERRQGASQRNTASQNDATVMSLGG